MKGLLLKEYYANQSTFTLTFVFLVIASLIINDNQIPAYSSILFTGTFLLSASYVDDQNKSHLLINSLPVNRRLVISSKYVSGLLIGMLLLIITIISNAFIPGYTPLTEMSIGLTAAMIIITIALYYPVYVIFGLQFMGYAFMVAMFGLLAMTPVISKTSFLDTATNFLQQQSTVTLNVGMIAVSIAILSLSWIISVRVYVAKQF